MTFFIGVLHERMIDWIIIKCVWKYYLFHLNFLKEIIFKCTILWSPLGFHTYLKLYLEQTISTKLYDLLHVFCWFVCTKSKTKVTTTTRERPSSYNQNNFIILMKFNRNNVGIEENFQVSSFTAFGLNNLMSTNMWHYRNNSIYMYLSISFFQLVWNLWVLFCSYRRLAS